MFLITTPVAYVLSSAAVLILSPLLPNWPFLALNLVVTVPLVFLLTFGAMPLATQLLRS